jgi:hypothetical protein
MTLGAAIAPAVAGLRALLDVPVEPDADQARSWLEAELAKPVYHQTQSLLDRFLGWLWRTLNGAGQAIGNIDPVMAAVVAVSVVAAAVGIGLLVAGPVRRARTAARASVDVLGDDTRSAAQLRADADAHAAGARWHEAVLDRFRAILRSLEERAVLDPRPGRTAHEAAELAGTRLPACASELAWAGRLFDDVCYGDVAADATADGRLRALDKAVTQTRPTALTERGEQPLVGTGAP